MGWGYVNGNSTGAIARAVLHDGVEKAKPSAANLYMSQLFAARETYWALPVHQGDLEKR
jgi:hypothetical protein